MTPSCVPAAPAWQDVLLLAASLRLPACCWCSSCRCAVLCVFLCVQGSSVLGVALRAWSAEPELRTLVTAAPGVLARQVGKYRNAAGNLLLQCGVRPRGEHFLA